MRDRSVPRYKKRATIDPHRTKNPTQNWCQFWKIIRSSESRDPLNDSRITQRLRLYIYKWNSRWAFPFLFASQADVQPTHTPRWSLRRALGQGFAFWWSYRRIFQRRKYDGKSLKLWCRVRPAGSIISKRPSYREPSTEIAIEQWRVSFQLTRLMISTLCFIWSKIIIFVFTRVTNDT